jgi:hypothetical protein
MRRTAHLLVAAASFAVGAQSVTAAPAEPAIAAAAEPFRPSGYVAGMVGTTVAYRPNGGSFLGPQNDVTVMAGVGVLARPDLAVELDAGVTMLERDEAAFALVPGVVWVFDPHFYAAGRMIITVAPEPNVALFPGLGATHLFDSGLAPFVEANLLSNVGQGEPDLGVTLTFGAVYNL